MTDPAACAPDIEEPQGDPADVEIPGVTDPDDMGDPADPADCAPEVAVPADVEDPADPTDAGTPDDPAVAEAAASSDDEDDDDTDADQAASGDTESTLPATDTESVVSEAPVDPRAAAFIAMMLAALAWRGSRRQEVSSER